MTTLESLKKALRECAARHMMCHKSSLTDAQYEKGFDIVARGSHMTAYQEFITP